MINHIKDPTGKEYSEYSDKEYHSCLEFVGSSELKKIARGKSTDYLGETTKDKIEFKIGTAFHLMVEDYAKGTKKFEEEFYITDLKRPIKILEMMSGEEEGKRSKDILNELKDNNHKFPLTREENRTISSMLNNFNSINFRGLKITDCITNSVFEKAFFWENEFKKKCKPDFFFFIDDEIFLFDIKTYRDDIEMFPYDFKKLAYYIQAAQYREGVQSHYPDYKVRPMSFAVSSKKSPYISGVYTLDQDEETILRIEQEYRITCERYKEWLNMGKERTGTIKEKQLFF